MNQACEDSKLPGGHFEAIKTMLHPLQDHRSGVGEVRLALEILSELDDAIAMHNRAHDLGQRGVGSLCSIRLLLEGL